MKLLTKASYVSLLAALLAVVTIRPSVAQDSGDDGGLADEQEQPEREKIAQTGMKFLDFSVDARAVALSDAVTSNLISGSTAMFYNPASMAAMQSNIDVAFGNAQWFADINYNSGAAAFRPGSGNMGVFGVSLLFVDYGEILETIRADNERGYENIGTLSPSAYAVGLGYARRLSDQVSIGGHLKYASESLGSNVLSVSDGERARGSNKESTVAFDFGVLYNTGFRSLVLGFSAHNISPELRYFREGFETPLRMSMGAEMNVFDMFNRVSDMHEFNLAVSAVRPRDYAEHINIGGEYVFFSTLALRGGYSIAGREDEKFSVGGGLQQAFSGINVSIDYAFTKWNFLDDVHRFSVNLGF